MKASFYNSNAYKVFINLLNGFEGICKNSHLTIFNKIILSFDLIRCIFFVAFSKLITVKKMYLYSFKYIIYFPNVTTFLYLFNEIFCKNLYPPNKNYLTIIDAGANIGIATLWLKNFSQKANVLLFEPDPENIQYLTKNLRENNITNTRIIPMALSKNKDKKVSFFKIDDKIQGLDSGLKLNQNLPYMKYTVQTTVLSDFINKQVDLLKMDIEGSEYSVIQDLIDNNKFKYINNLYLEAHYFNESELKKYKYIYNFLEKHGKTTNSDNSKLTCLNYYSRV